MSLMQALLAENAEPPLPPSFQASAYLVAGTSYGQIGTRQTALEPSVAGADIPMSWSCWVRPHNMGVGLQRAFGSFVPGGGVQQYSLVVRSAIETGSVNQAWQFGIFNGANFIRVVSSSRALKGRWVHMVITYSGSEAASGFNMYLNAVNDTTALKDSGGTYVGALNNASLRFQLSSDQNTYRGHIRDLAIWNKALNQTEVDELFNAGTPKDVSTVSFYGNIVANWPLHTDLVCTNNATFNVTNTSGIFFSTIPLSPYADGLSIFNGLVGNTRYIAFGTAVKRLDRAVFWLRSGTGHVDNGYTVKGSFDYTNLRAAAPVTWTGDILNALPNDLRGLYMGEINGTIIGFTSQYDDVALAFLSSGRYVSTDGLTGEAFGSYTSMQTPTAGQSINFYGKVIRGDNAGEYLVAFHEYTVGTQNIYIWRSTDNGATWTKDASPCFTAGGGGQGYNEPCILNAGGGRYVMLVREQAGAQLSCSVSSDNAVTWTAPVDSTLATGTAMADMCLNPAGQIVVAYADRGTGELKISNYNNVADVMANRADWNTGVAVWKTIDGTNNILGYPWIVSNGWHFALGVSSEQSSTRADHFVGYGFLGLI